MTFTNAQLELLTTAYLADQIGHGLKLAADAFPEAQPLLDAGWLTIQFADDGDMLWAWSPAAAHTLEARRIARAAAASAN
jgi:hypothetical protein